MEHLGQFSVSTMGETGSVFGQRQHATSHFVKKMILGLKDAEAFSDDGGTLTWQELNDVFYSIQN